MAKKGLDAYWETMLRSIQSLIISLKKSLIHSTDKLLKQHSFVLAGMVTEFPDVFLHR